MSLEENKTIIRRYFTQVIEQCNEEILGELMAQDVIAHDATDSKPKLGLESVKQVLKLFHTAFPSFRCPLYDLLAEGNKVVARWGLRGSHQGPFLGIPASGNVVEVSGMMLFRLRDRKIVEYWGNFDMLGLMKQIGALPEDSC